MTLALLLLLWCCIAGCWYCTAGCCCGCGIVGCCVGATCGVLALMRLVNIVSLLMTASKSDAMQLGCWNRNVLSSILWLSTPFVVNFKPVDATRARSSRRSLFIIFQSKSLMSFINVANSGYSISTAMSWVAGLSSICGQSLHLGYIFYGVGTRNFFHGLGIFFMASEFFFRSSEFFSGLRNFLADLDKFQCIFTVFS